MNWLVNTLPQYPGTDCQIEEPPKTDGNRKYPFDKKWYVITCMEAHFLNNRISCLNSLQNRFSHKFKGAGVRYEVAVCIATGHIVWVNGPFPCGAWPDIKIFRFRLKRMLRRGEKVEADRGYRGDPSIWTPDNYLTLSEKRAKEVARARHEAINSLLKNFGCLSSPFRHELRTHRNYFSLAAVCVQLMIEERGPPFHVNY